MLWGGEQIAFRDDVWRQGYLIRAPELVGLRRHAGGRRTHPSAVQGACPCMPTRVEARLAPPTSLCTILYPTTSMNLESFHPHQLELCPTHTMSAASQVVGRCASIDVSRSTFRSRDRPIADFSAVHFRHSTQACVCVLLCFIDPMVRESRARGDSERLGF